MEVLFGKTLEELGDVAASLNLPSYTAKQMAQWLYRHRAKSVREFSNLSKAARTALEENYILGTSAPVSEAVSADGTKKYLFPAGGSGVEATWIPEKKRSTLCVSSQIGCKRGCRFCLTARQGFNGNLSAGEILNQFRSLPEFESVTNFVFMGMGEPLDNMEALLSALEILTSDWGYGISPKRITVSTIGIVPNLKRLIENTECRLALSLHSPFPGERSDLIPSERKYPLEEVLKVFRSTDRGKRRLTVEYLLIKKKNDTPAHSAQLARLLKGLDARVNLIPYHPIPGFSGETTPPARQEAFRDELNRRGITATIRHSRGLDIGAACGMLSTREKEKAEKARRASTN